MQTKQGLSASQMTAAKVMDVIARHQPGCGGQPADAISAFSQGEMADASSLLKKSQSENVQVFEYVHRNTNGQNHGPEWKTQSFLLSEICTVILW